MMNDQRAAGQAEEDEMRAGLCSRCAHMELVVSSRGMRFYLCRRSYEDPAFPRYPRIPVVQCPGYERRHDG